MKNLTHFLALTVLALGVESRAVLLTDLPGAVTSAGSCYTGCGYPVYDASNILDDDFGASGNNGLNSWNSGFWGGYVQVDFQQAYVLDRVELYGAYSYYNPFVLSGSLNGTNWFSIGSGGYHVEPELTQTETYLGIKYGAVFDAGNGSLGSNIETRFLRYTVSAGSPHWGYMFEMRADGHLAAVVPPTGGDPQAVPEPGTLACMGLGMLMLAFTLRRRRA